MSRRQCAARVVAALWLGAVWHASATAAPPTITQLSVVGLQSGTTTRLVVEGTDLLPAPRIAIGLPIAAQGVVGTPTNVRVELDVTLPAGVPAGVYSLRVMSDQGISPPRLVAVDHLPQVVAGSGTASLPVAVSTTVAGAATREIRFHGRKSEAISIDVLSRRLGSAVRPVVHLYDPSRSLVAWSLPQLAVMGDVRLAATLPVDGVYTCAVHDAQYAAAPPNQFRIAIGGFDYVSETFPTSIARQSPSPTLELLGRGGQRAVATAEPAVDADWRLLAWPAGWKPVGLRPAVTLSDVPEHLAASLAANSGLPGTPRQIPGLPAAVHGRLAAAGEDVYTVAVTAGDTLRCELFADRLGAAVDALLEIRDESGKRLATNDDMVGADPVVEFPVPANAKQLLIAARSLGGGPASAVYRLLVTSKQAVARPDFRFMVAEQTINVVPGGTRLVRVEAERKGYDGPITVEAVGLPAGCTAAPTVIPAGVTAALVEFRADPSRKPDWGSVRLVGRGSGEAASLRRVASLSSHPLVRQQPWVAEELSLASTLPRAAAWGVDFATAIPSPLYQGRDASLSILVRRDAAAAAPVRLSLVTSGSTLKTQVPTVDVPVDAPAKAAIDELARLEKQRADAERSQAAAGASPAAVEAAKAAIEKLSGQIEQAGAKVAQAMATATPPATMPLVGSETLPAGEYDLAIRAELRSADNARVVDEAFSPVRRVSIVAPLKLDLAAGSDGPVKLDPKQGAEWKITGTLARLGGCDGDMTLTLTGLPQGVAAPRVVLKKDQAEFTLSVKLPPTAKAEQFAAVKVSASGPADARRPQGVVRAERAVGVRLEPGGGS